MSFKNDLKGSVILITAALAILSFTGCTGDKTQSDEGSYSSDISTAVESTAPDSDAVIGSTSSETASDEIGSIEESKPGNTASEETSNTSSENAAPEEDNNSGTVSSPEPVTSSAADIPQIESRPAMPPNSEEPHEFYIPGDDEPVQSTAPASTGDHTS